jgi:hypothetical protein
MFHYRPVLPFAAVGGLCLAARRCVAIKEVRLRENRQELTRGHTTNWYHALDSATNRFDTRVVPRFGLTTKPQSACDPSSACRRDSLPLAFAPRPPSTLPITAISSVRSGLRITLIYRTRATHPGSSHGSARIARHLWFRNDVRAILIATEHGNNG